MAEVAIEALGGNAFRVVVRANGDETTHRVSVPSELGSGHDLERVVRASFEFLLEREPPSAILSEFALDRISYYFPEYREELAPRLADTSRHGSE